ncbi:MAG: SGNH/GDSL hydrolase family protein [Clostridia bacterium]
MNILFFGDSNTFGTDPAGGPRHSRDVRFTGILQKELGDNYYIIEEGLGGRTTVFDDPTEEGRCGFDYIVPCLRSHKPIDLLVIMLGTNDVKERFGANAALITVGMERLIKKVFCVDGVFRDKQNILLICPCAVKEGVVNVTPNRGLGSEERSRELIPLYRDLAKKLNIPYMVADDYAEASDIDKVHLDAKSHHALATAIKEKILEIEETT